MGHPTLSPAYQLWHGENRPQHLMLSKHALGALGPVGNNPTVHALKILPTANCRKNTLNLRFLTQTRPKNSQLPSFQDLTFRLPHPICKWTTKDCPLLTWDPSNFPILQHHGWLWQRFGFPGLQSPHQNKNPWSANKARRRDKANDAPVAMSHELWKHPGHSWIPPWSGWDWKYKNLQEPCHYTKITDSVRKMFAKHLESASRSLCRAAIVPSMKVGYVALIVGYACGKGFRSRCSAFVHFVSRVFCFAVVVGADLGPPFAVVSWQFPRLPLLPLWIDEVYSILQRYLISEEEGAKSDANGVQFGRIAWGCRHALICFVDHNGLCQVFAKHLVISELQLVPLPLSQQWGWVTCVNRWLGVWKRFPLPLFRICASQA